MLERSRHIIDHDRERPRRPRDPNQLAKRIVDIATGEVEDKARAVSRDEGKYPAAVSLGRRGGLTGGEGTGGQTFSGTAFCKCQEGCGDAMVIKIALAC